eukprot:scaffold1879_cov178-Amphora_coffeaeformis.AAC.10
MTTTGSEDNDRGVDKQDIPMEDNPPMDRAARKKEAESAESSSTGSSEGKSGSGEGYSADCSASDQSSDENGDRKETSSNLNLSVGGLNLHDREASRSSDSSEDGEQRETNDEQTDQENGNAGSNANQGDGDDQDDTYSLGIDLPLKSPDAIDLESMMRAKTEEERETATVLQNHRVLPQWNGVRIAQPMDPRIDLSTVTVLQAGIVPLTFQLHADQEQPDNPKPAEENTPPFSVDNYSQLMEVIRPFFQSHGVAWQQWQSQIENQWRNESGSDQVDSSEGFTSFFTTTHSGTNSGGTTNSGSPQSSDLDKKPQAVNTSKPEKESDNGDASSMVVLARVKRKHRKEEDSSNSASSGDKRVRIQDRAEEQRGQGPVVPAYEADANGGSSGSSSLSNAPNQAVQQLQPAPLHISVPPRIVTDSSSAKMSSATSSNVNTSASGSGSGGNTGSGSNQGSSGSGNEGKASSEEPTQGDNNGESPLDGSDQSSKRPGQASEYEPRHDGANREQKLLDKKRKRIEMRREYEAQQQIESSESSDPSVSLVRPGKPVTMDQVLRFSKIARIVLQATPPFLIVHTNAAFARLTGIDSHQAVGQPISSMVMLPERPQTQHSQQQAAQDESNPQASDTSSTEMVDSPAKMFELERLIATSGHGKIQLLKVLSRQHQMVGRSVTITKEVPESGKQDGSTRHKDGSVRQDGSKSSSKSSGFHCKTCKASIAPIVSVSAYMPNASAGAEKDIEPPKQKRRRSHSQGNEEVPALSTPTMPEGPAKDHKTRPPSPNKDHKKNPSRLVVTHYIIQLEDANTKSGNNHLSMESLSSNSTSVEARLIGLSKEMYKNQKIAASGIHQELQDTPGQPEEEGEGSESTVVPEHVSAMG